MTAPANLRGWGQGWPVDRSDDMRRVAAYRSGTDFDVHFEIAPLIKHIIDEIERRGYLLDHGVSDVDDDWSYSNRPIRGRRVPSNHSWGLAIDVDAQEYPMGTRRNPPRWIIDLFAFYRFDWGGVWSRPDPMHFEFNGTPREARWLVASLAGHHIVQTPAPVPATVPPPALAIRVPEEDDMGKWFRINDQGQTSHHGKVFHVYGRKFVHLNAEEWEADQLFHGVVAKEVTSAEFLAYVARRNLTDGRT